MKPNILVIGSTILALFSFFGKYMLEYFGIKAGYVLDPAFTLFSIVAISVYFDNKTREALFSKLDEYFHKITVPNFEEVRAPVKEFLTHLNSSALPYERSRELVLRFELADNDTHDLLKITTIYQTSYDREHLKLLSRSRKEIIKNFMLSFPEEAIKHILETYQNDEDILRKLKRQVVITLNESNTISIFNESLERKKNFLLYFFTVSIPIEKLLESFRVPILKMKTSHTYKNRDGYYTLFRTFCKSFRLQLLFDNNILERFTVSDIQQHIQIHPISFKNVRNSENYREIPIDNHHIEVCWEDVIPGSALLVEWDFTLSSPPTP
ncbi:hypothetical protein [Desulfurobacterium crinifex]